MAKVTWTPWMGFSLKLHNADFDDGDQSIGSGRPAHPLPEGFVWQPRMDMYTTEAGAVIQAELPGIPAQDIQLEVEGRELRLCGICRPARETGVYQVMECSHGPFCRTLLLPEGLDGSKVQASLRDGLLTITVPKAEAQRSRRILVD